MRIKRVEIENFQSHKSTNVDLDDRFTMLVGTSNSGKSSFLRAIKWCLRNVPSGNDFIRIGQKSAKVKLHFDNGHAVERERGKGASLNYYRLFKDDELLEEFTGFGTGVPDMIKDVVGEEKDWEYTFADQLEAPYLIADTPRVRAEKIGNFEEFSKLDKVITEIKEEEREAKKTERNTKKELTEILSNIKTIDDEIAIVKPMYEKINEAYEIVSEKSKKASELSRLHTRLSEIEGEIPILKDKVLSSKFVMLSYDGLEDKVKKYNDIKLLSRKLESTLLELGEIRLYPEGFISNLVDEVQNISSMVEKYKVIHTLNVNLKRNEDNLSNIPKINHEVIRIDLNPIESAIEKYQKVVTLKKSLEANHEGQEHLKQNVSTAFDKIEGLLNEFVEEIRSNAICPTCTQDTESVDINTIKQNL